VIFRDCPLLIQLHISAEPIKTHIYIRARTDESYSSGTSIGITWGGLINHCPSNCTNAVFALLNMGCVGKMQKCSVHAVINFNRMFFSGKWHYINGASMASARCVTWHSFTCLLYHLCQLASLKLCQCTPEKDVERTKKQIHCRCIWNPLQCE
jgi:hypothetical protein